MANSSLATYTRISPHNSGTRTSKISKITIHHMSGKMTGKACADYFATTDREVSSNYCIGYGGDIAVSVNESDRSWCSSSRSNDQAAVTIEVSNIANSASVDPDWKISDEAMKSLIKLCADVCKRNGIKKLYYDGTTNATLTRHCMFASTDCPGPYIKSKTTYICDEVNKLIGATTTTTTTQTQNKTTTTTTTTKTTTTTAVKAGDTVQLSSKATYYNGKTIPDWVKNTKWIVKSVSGDRAIIDKSADGKNSIMSPVNTKYLTVVKNTAATTFTPYKIRVTSDSLSIRKGAGTNYAIVGQIKDRGIYTIVGEAKDVNGTKWLKLKSGAGYISADGTKKI